VSFGFCAFCVSLSGAVEISPLRADQLIGKLHGAVDTQKDVYLMFLRESSLKGSKGTSE